MPKYHPELFFPDQLQCRPGWNTATKSVLPGLYTVSKGEWMSLSSVWGSQITKQMSVSKWLLRYRAGKTSVTSPDKGTQAWRVQKSCCCRLPSPPQDQMYRKLISPCQRRCVQSPLTWNSLVGPVFLEKRLLSPNLNNCQKTLPVFPPASRL